MLLSRFRFSVQLLVGLLSALSVASCEKIALSDAEEQAGAAGDCPDLAHTIAALENGTAPDITAGLLAFFTPAQIADLKANSCRTIERLSGSSADDRAAGYKGRFWAPGATIRVRFLNGSTALQNAVFNQAREWEQYADVHFQRVADGMAEVRVLFGTDGHWSYIGTFHQAVDACEETMSLEFSDQTPSAEIRRVVLHEFGHVLGLLHEHQQPLASIPWNTQAVYAYYAQQDWDRADVDEQVLDRENAAQTQFTEFDASSIMEYPVPAALTTNGFSIGWNTQLSAADKSFVRLMYGANQIRVRHAATGYNSSIMVRVAGIYHTLRSGETLSVPVQAGGSTLAIQETNGAWDATYATASGQRYKIVRSGNDFSLTAD